MLCLWKYRRSIYYKSFLNISHDTHLVTNDIFTSNTPRSITPQSNRLPLHIYPKVLPLRRICVQDFNLISLVYFFRLHVFRTLISLFIGCTSISVSVYNVTESDERLFIRSSIQLFISLFIYPFTQTRNLQERESLSRVLLKKSPTAENHHQGSCCRRGRSSDFECLIHQGCLTESVVNGVFKDRQKKVSLDPGNHCVRTESRGTYLRRQYTGSTREIAVDLTMGRETFPINFMESHKLQSLKSLYDPLLSEGVAGQESQTDTTEDRCHEFHFV